MKKIRKQFHHVRYTSISKATILFKLSAVSKIWIESSGGSFKRNYKYCVLKMLLKSGQVQIHAVIISVKFDYHQIKKSHTHLQYHMFLTTKKCA